MKAGRHLHGSWPLAEPARRGGESRSWAGSSCGGGGEGGGAAAKASMRFAGWRKRKADREEGPEWRPPFLNHPKEEPARWQRLEKPAQTQKQLPGFPCSPLPSKTPMRTGSTGRHHLSWKKANPSEFPAWQAEKRHKNQPPGSDSLSAQTLQTSRPKQDGGEHSDQALARPPLE